jgi:hypothetical protein
MAPRGGAGRRGAGPDGGAVRADRDAGRPPSCPRPRPRSRTPHPVDQRHHRGHRAAAGRDGCLGQGRVLGASPPHPVDQAPPGRARPASAQGRPDHHRAHLRRARWQGLPAVHLPDGHSSLLRPGRQVRRASGPRHLRLPNRRKGRDPLPRPGRPLLPEPASRRGVRVLRRPGAATAPCPRTSMRRCAAPSPARTCAWWPQRRTTRCCGRRPTR